MRAVDRGVVHVQQARRAELREEDLVQTGPDVGFGPVLQAPLARHPTAADRLGRHVRPGHARAQDVDDPAQSRRVIRQTADLDTADAAVGEEGAAERRVPTDHQAQDHPIPAELCRPPAQLPSP